MDLDQRAIHVWRASSFLQPLGVSESEVKYVGKNLRPAKAGITSFCRKAVACVLKTERSLTKDVKVEGKNLLKSFNINKRAKKDELKLSAD